MARRKTTTALATPVQAQLTAALNRLQLRLESDASRRAYAGDWARWVRWAAHANVNVAAATPADVAQYLTAMQDNKAARATRQRALSVLRSVYSELVVARICTANPAREVRNSRIDKQPRTPYLDEEGLRRLVAACDSNTWQGRRDRMILLLLIGLGWRRSEIARLRVNDFAGDLSTVTGRLKRGKVVTVGVPSVLQVELRAWITQENVNHAILPRSPTNQRPVSDEIVYDSVRRIAARAAAIPENAAYKDRFAAIAPHGIRRSDATILLVDTDTPIADVQSMLGHASVTTTELYLKAARAARLAPGQLVLERVLPASGTRSES